MTLHSSQMGRGGRDDRRRRLLAEDRTAGSGGGEASEAGPAARGAAVKHKSENYGDAEFLDAQARLTDLVPRRLLSLVLLLKVGIAVIAGLVMFYIAAPRIFNTPESRPAAAILGGPGSLANWVSSLFLLLAGVLALGNYTVRRHKTDDYRGRYRVWLWAAICWFVMASDVAASLHQAFQQAMISLVHTPLVGDGTIWWLAPAVVVVAAVGTWLLIDMRASRLASTALVLAAVAYGVALFVFFRAVRMPSELLQVVLLQASLLAGHLLLAWSMALHARFVLMDAEGRLPRRSEKAKPKRQRAAKPKGNAASDAAKSGAADDAARRGDVAKGDESGNKWIAVDPPHGGSTPVLKRVGSTVSATPPLGQKISALVSQGASHSSNASAPDESKMSKADRKALKKKMLDERLKAEQRKASNW